MDTKNQETRTANTNERQDTHPPLSEYFRKEPEVKPEQLYNSDRVTITKGDIAGDGKVYGTVNKYQNYDFYANVTLKPTEEGLNKGRIASLYLYETMPEIEDSLCVVSYLHNEGWLCEEDEYLSRKERKVIKEIESGFPAVEQEKKQKRDTDLRQQRIDSLRNRIENTRNIGLEPKRR